MTFLCHFDVQCIPIFFSQSCVFVYLNKCKPTVLTANMLIMVISKSINQINIIKRIISRSGTIKYIRFYLHKKSYLEIYKNNKLYCNTKLSFPLLVVRIGLLWKKVSCSSVVFKDGRSLITRRSWKC